MSSSRYARQISVPGVGARGHAAIERAEVSIGGNGLAAEVCALYLTGAGIGTVRVPPPLVESCRGLSSDVDVIASDDLVDSDTVEVSVGTSGGPRARFSVPASDDPVRDGSIAARWALATVLSKGTGDQ